VQNGNHIETYQDGFPQLELIMPHAQKAFDLLVQQVENKVALPPSQCIPRGGSIAATPAPAQAGSGQPPVEVPIQVTLLLTEGLARSLAALDPGPAHD